MDCRETCQIVSRWLKNMTVLEKFEQLGNKASFYYADDTASGEWVLGHTAELAATKLYVDNPELQNVMRQMAKGFLWKLPKREKS